MLRRILLIILISGALLQSSMGQEEIEEPFNGEVISSSPEASSLGTYGDIPFDYHTGRATYSYPVYTIKAGEVSLPISLTYSSSGLKVADPIERTGMGWSLNAGGVVSTTVRGAPDYEHNGMQKSTTINQKIRDYYAETLTEDEKVDFLQYAVTGQWDTQPDLFSYNTGNMTGKFMIDLDGDIHHIPSRRINIVRISDTSWEIEDLNGTKYLFDKTETSSSEYGERVTTALITSWYLSKISLANGIDEITFEYATSSRIQAEYKTESRLKTLADGVCSGAGGYITSTGQQTFNGHRLEKIIFPGGSLEFINGDTRTDNGGGSTLGEIVLYRDTEAVKSWTLNYGYFGNDIARSKRLKLKSITESGVGATSFDYYNENSTDYPSWDLYQTSYYKQDHWGFFNSNSKTHHKTLIPKNPFFTAYAERSPDWSKAVYGMLKTITYPTGGLSEFEYEGNIVDRASVPDDGSGGDAGALCDLDFNSPDVTTISILNDDTNGHYITEGFTIEQTQCVQLDYHLFAKDLAASGEGSAEIKLMTANNQVLHHEYVTSSPAGQTLRNLTEIKLYPGNYKLYTYVEIGQHVECFVDAEMKFFAADITIIPLKVGGVRVKKITSCPSEDTDCMTKVFSYIDEDLEIFKSGTPGTDEIQSSTGRLLYNPIYGYFSFSKNEVNICPSYAISSHSQAPLYSEPCVYDKVTVYEGDKGENGKTVYEYLNRIDDISYRFPFAPGTDYSFRRGLLLKKAVYAKDSSEYRLVSSQENSYKLGGINEPNNSAVYGIKVGVGYIAGHEDDESRLGYAQFVIEDYLSHSAWDYMTQSTNRQYGSGTTALSTVTSYSYENPDHAQLTKTEVTGSDGTKYITRLKYPDDYSGSGNGFIIAMQNDNRYHLPVEQQVWVAEDGTEKLLRAAVTYYTKINNTYLPSEFRRTTNAEALSDYVNSTDADNPISDTRYELNTTYGYTTAGNLTSIEKKDDISTAYIYGYGDLRLPVAKVLNAGPDEVFFENFEDIEGNNSARSYTGIKSYYGTVYNVPFTPPANGKTYMMDYRKWESGGWKLYRNMPFQQSISIQGSYIDDLRVYPAGALINSYTYLPLTGMTSETDPNGNTTFYEYDAHGRLLKLKDHEGNILQETEYNYGH